MSRLIPEPERAERASGERGSSLVAAVAILFATTFLGLVWLSRDVDRGVSQESTAQSIAFQAARAAAQRVAADDLRTGTLALDPVAGRSGAAETAARLFASYGVTGSVTGFSVDPVTRRVVVEITITDGGVTVSGTGIVTAEQTP